VVAAPKGGSEAGERMSEPGHHGRIISAGLWLVEQLYMVALGWRSWILRAWDGITHGLYRRQIRAAEALGDQVMLADWVERRERAKAERARWLAGLPMMVLGLGQVTLRIGLWTAIGLPVLAGLVELSGAGRAEALLSAVRDVVAWLLWLAGLLLQALWYSTPALLVVGGWREGRRQGTGPSWLPTSADPDVDVEIDESTIARALDGLRIPPITAYLKQGLPLQFIVTARREGRGTYAAVRLPGVAAEEICQPQRRARLASGLYRSTKEVWPSTGSEAGILELWVADKGALAEGAGPYPLLFAGSADFFKGVPLGKTLRGDPIVAPLNGRNTITGGIPGQGKSSSARSTLAGAALDPTVEIRIYVPDANFDFELVRRRAAVYIMGAEDDKVRDIRDDLIDLHEEVQRRGQILVDQEQPEVTRALADADIGLHPIVTLLEEAHVAFQHKIYGKEIQQLVIDIVRLGRKRGIHMIVSTQAPTKDSIPRDVTRNCSNGIAFAVGDHVANDALLGQGAYRAGHRATELIPGVDIGTALCKGLNGERSEVVQVYFISIAKEKDELTPLIDRAMELIAERGKGVPGRRRHRDMPPPRDLLEDLAAVLGDQTIPAADLPALLSKLAPYWLPYRGLTGVALREQLADLGVRVPSTGNRWPVSPELIREALADRLLGEEVMS
jgi:DNA segregation ATPase FtsK/SpoIIIE, S-DNA-T family